RIAAVRFGDCHTHGAEFCPNGFGHDTQIWVQAVVQSIVHDGRESDRLVGHAVSLRHRSRPGSPDDRELPLRFALGHHAPLLTGVDRLASGRLYWGLVVTLANLARHDSTRCETRQILWSKD